MRVKCINDKWKADVGCEEAPRPVFNQDYTVSEHKIIGALWVFVLVELGDEYAYDARFFAILPDTSADDMAEAEKEAIVNLETA
jgi:hypothetical protein